MCSPRVWHSLAWHRRLALPTLKYPSFEVQIEWWYQRNLTKVISKYKIYYIITLFIQHIYKYIYILKLQK